MTAMSCAIEAYQNGSPCDGALRDAVDRHVAALESAGAELRSCRLVLDSRHRKHASGSYVFALLEVWQAGARQPLPSSHAIEDTPERALETVFQIAGRALRQAQPGGAAPEPGMTPCHVVSLAADFSGGTLEAADGRMLDFVAADAGLEALRALHVGDRAWLTRRRHDDPPSLVCVRRGRSVSVPLHRLG